jgi:hypothetical protein
MIAILGQLHMVNANEAASLTAIGGGLVGAPVCVPTIPGAVVGRTVLSGGRSLTQPGFTSSADSRLAGHTYQQNPVTGKEQENLNIPAEPIMWQRERKTLP